MLWVNFRFSNRVIGTMHYAIVIAGITSGTIKCRVDPAMVTNGAAAVYDPKSNTIFALKADVSFPDTKMTLVHEATHAILDLMRSPMKILANETYAFLAGAIYVNASGQISPFKAGTILAVAHDLVRRRNINFQGNGNAASPIEFTDQDVRPLEAAIKQSPLYKPAFAG